MTWHPAARSLGLLAIAVAISAGTACTATPEPSSPSEEAGAQPEEPVPPMPVDERSYAEDLAFLQEHATVVELQSADGSARAVVAPQWQGRVMTSTAGGADGHSFGWLNYDLIASGEMQPHINALGGEDRFWLGPEGGQFSIFFAPDDPFDLEHWQTPPAIDTEAYRVVSSDPDEVAMRHSASLTNYSRTQFDLRVDRSVRLLSAPEVADLLGTPLPPALRMVAFESENTLSNVGSVAWSKERGLLSIWILGMFKHSPMTTVVIPFRPGPVDRLGPIVNDAYFGKVPADRLRVADDALFFKGDGQYRSKIGLGPDRATPVAGSYDPQRGVLTIVHYTRPEGARDYVNSMWEIQDEPYAGDVINSYNDGPPAPGAAPLGPFYELETSSPAAALGAGESLTHRHRTIHLLGERDVLQAVAEATLGVTLVEIEGAFGR